MTLFYALAILIFPVIIGGNVLIFHLIIRRAIKRFVDPLLNEKGLSYVGYKWPGLFSQGDFKDGNIGFTTLAKTGTDSISIYSFIYYKDVKADLAKRVTIRIDVINHFFIEKVVYNSKI